MKVLLINSVCGMGSTGRICTDLAKYYENHDIETVIAYGRNSSLDIDPAKTIRIGNTFDVNIHGALTRIFDQHGFGSRLSTKLLLKKIDSFSPDVIHLHNLHGYYINIDILFDYIRRRKTPTVWTLHDCWAFTGHCTHFDRINCSKWIDGCHDCPQTRLYPSSFFDFSELNYKKKKQILENVENLIIATPSEWMKKYIIKSFLGKNSIRVIPNGIDTKIFTKTDSDIRKKYNIHEKYIVLGVSSGWPDTKRLVYFEKLSSDLGNDYKVVVIGINDEQRNKLPSNMIGLLKTSNVHELVEWYSAASVFLNPTVEDNYPTVNLEAQSCGTPVVTFNTGGCPETIQNNYGLVINKDDYDGLRKATVDMCERGKPDLIPHILDKSEIAQKYIELYEELI